MLLASCNSKDNNTITDNPQIIGKWRWATEGPSDELEFTADGKYLFTGTNGAHSSGTYTYIDNKLVVKMMEGKELVTDITDCFVNDTLMTINDSPFIKQ